jgi:hypothetical protein
MSKIPTAEELLLEEIKKFSTPLTSESLQLLVINVANQHAKNHVEVALKQAFIKSNVTHGFKDAILNAYPLTNIK